MLKQKEVRMRALYEKWQSSGQGKKDFALSEGLHPSTFSYWIKKFEQPTPAIGDFLPVEVEERFAPSILATIHYPSGVKVEWHGGSGTIDQLKALL